MNGQGAKKDSFSNIINVQVVESAANTLTFEEINVGLNLFDKAGLIIHRIDYHLVAASLNLLIANGDLTGCAITQSNSIDTLTPSERAVVDKVEFQYTQVGTPGNFEIHDMPLTKDYSSLPGGGILVTPKPLYAAIRSLSLASAATVNIRLWFTVKKLSPADYFELLETRQYFG